MLKALTTTAAIALVATPALAQEAEPRAAAAYIKIGDIKGESNRSGWSPSSGSLEHTDDWIAARAVAWTNVGEALDKGHVWLDADSDGDGLEDRASRGDIRVNRIDMAARADGVDNDCDDGDATVCPRDAASGMATAKRQHKPVSVAKELDKSSPKLAENLSGGGGAGKASMRGGIDKATPYLYKALDRSTPLLFVRTAYDRCEPGTEVGDFMVRQGNSAYHVAGATVAACESIRQEVTNNKSAANACNSCGVWLTFDERHEIEYQDGSDMVVRKKPGRR